MAGDRALAPGAGRRDGCQNSVGGTYSDDFSLPGAESGQGSAVLAEHDIVGGSNSARLVFRVDTGTLSSQSAAIEQAVTQVRAVPHVVSFSDPPAAGSTAPGGRIPFGTITFDDKPAVLGSTLTDGIDKATDPVRAAGVQVDYSGRLGKAAEPGAGDFGSELIGLVVAILVLLLAFGSVFAAGLPIVTSIIGVATGLGILGLLAALITFATASPTLAIMIGFGGGIDFALFLTTRFRQHLIDGDDPATAAGRTVATSGRSVLIAATTLVPACSAWPVGGSTAGGCASPPPSSRPTAGKAAGTATSSASTAIRGAGSAAACWWPRCSRYPRSPWSWATSTRAPIRPAAPRARPTTPSRPASARAPTASSRSSWCRATLRRRARAARACSRRWRRRPALRRPRH
ncbi:MMPL family transporter [Amycolatopsis sp. FDAARGOS 1241]|nr:MMPL family transporter [Amycolatopsis sp. FDAARGOS 1241]